jgi:hypothetical protein
MSTLPEQCLSCLAVAISYRFKQLWNTTLRQRILCLSFPAVPFFPKAIFLKALKLLMKNMTSQELQDQSRYHAPKPFSATYRRERWGILPGIELTQGQS